MLNKLFVSTVVSVTSSSILIAKSNRPNIVFLMADDQQAFAMGCMGNKDIHTPNLDKLANSGTLFTKAYSTSPICMPSRATTITGMYEFKTGCNFSCSPLRLKDWLNNSYPMILKQNGYFIGFAGKWGIKSDPLMKYETDFDMWGGFKGDSQGKYQTEMNPSLKKYASKYPHVTRALGAFSSDFIQKAVKQDKPFCLSISFKAPHKPHNYIDTEDLKLYDKITLSKRENYGLKHSGTLAKQALLGRQYAQWYEWQPDRYQEHLKQYYQLISGVDSVVGKIIKELKSTGVYKNTVIIYTSDNGYALGSHALQGKTLPYEECSRIPLIVFDGRLESQDKKCNSLVANIDYAPTILSIAGITPPPRMDGKSLLPLLKDSSKTLHNSILLIQNWGINGSETNKCLAILKGDYKYIFWPYGDENITPTEELYNTANDKYEDRNILLTNSPQPETLFEMRKLYDINLKRWSENAVNSKYKESQKLFDRTIPYKDKNFRLPRKYVTKAIYEEVIGEKAPIGFKEAKQKK